MPGDRVFDRSAEDIGNIILLEHVNVKIPDQVVATNFYVTALGLTRDPYIMTGTENMWINAGQQQFHMPNGKPEVLRGTIGFVIPDLEGLKTRLMSSREKLGGTKFNCAAEDKYISVTCPWGNRMRFHAPGPEFGDMTLGVPYVEFDVRPNTAVGIAKFYQTAMGAPGTGARPPTPRIARPVARPPHPQTRSAEAKREIKNKRRDIVGTLIWPDM